MNDRLLPGLHWGIKASFLDYISGMSDGQGTIAHGARPTNDNIMVFEPAPEVRGPDDADLFLAFRGDIRFAGHHGMLYVRIADPWVTVRGAVAEMTVLDPYKPQDEPRLTLVRFTLVPTVDRNPTGSWSSTDVRLAPEATELFNGVYPAGEPFEPLDIHLPTISDPSDPREGRP